MSADNNVAALLAALAGRTTQPQNPSNAAPQSQPAASSLNQASLASLAQTLSAATAAQPGGLNLSALTQLAQNPSALTALQQFSVPQPTSSGSLDLSKMVVPSSSGTVNINMSDTLAKLRNRAAEAGLQSGGPSRYDDPRLNRRRSRSRSRSPGSRDRYRGDFDRRDDRRGGRGYDRERSFSPNSRRGGPYSPPQQRNDRNGAAPGGPGRFRERDPDVTMFQMRVDSSLVGLIIGRGGETLRRVEQDTGCKVQFLTGAEYRDLPDRPCNITGTPQQIQKAKKAIEAIIEENAKSGNPPPPKRGGGNEYTQRQGSVPQVPFPQLREGEESLQIMVPDRTVGLIIGRHGETIRDLQERSGCHINIVGESKSVNGLRPVNLIGSGDSAKRAKDLIMEIVDSDIRSQASGAPVSVRLPGGGPSGYFGGAGPSGEKAVQTMKVPIEAVGMIIGRGGDTIKEMQASTGCRINVSSNYNPNDSEREITLQGQPEAIEAARQAINEKVASALQKKQQGGNRNESYGGNDNYDYASPQRNQRQDHTQQHQSGAAQSTAPSNTAGTAAGDDPYAPWGGYQAYAQMYYAMLAQQQAASGQTGQSGAPGTS